MSFIFQPQRTIAGICAELERCFEDPARWTRDALARDACGNPVDCLSNFAVCWCAVGARLRCVEGNSKLSVAFARLWQKHTGVPSAMMNDYKGREAVLAVLKTLPAFAREQGFE